MKKFTINVFVMAIILLSTACADTSLEVREIDRDVLMLENGCFISIATDAGHNIEVGDILEFNDHSLTKMMTYDIVQPDCAIGAYSKRLDEMLFALPKGCMKKAEKIVHFMPLSDNATCFRCLAPYLSNESEEETFSLNVVVLENNTLGLLISGTDLEDNLSRRLHFSSYCNELWQDRREGYYSKPSGYWIPFGTIVPESLLRGNITEVDEDCLKMKLTEDGRELTLQITKLDKVDLWGLWDTSTEDKVNYIEFDLVDYDPIINIIENVATKLERCFLIIEADDVKEVEDDLAVIRNDFQNMKALIYSENCKEFNLVNRVN